MAPISRIQRTSRTTPRARWTTALAGAVIALATFASAQTVPSAPSASGPNQDLARQHLTAARNALNDVTQLPAASQLAGNSRRLVQQLITDFNALITTNDEWRATYDKVSSSLAALLEPASPEPAAATAGVVGTSGTSNAIDSGIRAKLVEFRAHLDQFESVASGSNATPTPDPPDAPPAPPTPDPAAAPPATPPTEERPESPPTATPDPEDPQEVVGAARDLLLHVEAIEVILGAQSEAQKDATAAAGGAVVTSPTASGSTKTTVTDPNVTLNVEQLDQLKSHLTAMRRLLERK